MNTDHLAETVFSTICHTVDLRTRQIQIATVTFYLSSFLNLFHSYRFKEHVLTYTVY